MIATTVALSGCAGGAGRLKVASNPPQLTAYAIPASVWYRADEPLQDVLDQPSRYAKYKYGQLTETHAKSLRAGTYFVVVTDGAHAEFTETKVYRSSQDLSVTLDLVR